MTLRIPSARKEEIMRTNRLALGIAVLALAYPAVAHASGYQAYRICGGDTFATCAAVSINVAGPNVTVRVWNLSGNAGATYGTNTYAGTIFNGIGFYNTGSASAVLGSLSVTGPARPGDTPHNWRLSNSGRVGFGVDFKATSGQFGGNGISSGCALPGQLPSDVNLYQNPCNSAHHDPNNYVTFSFQITGSWNPKTSDLSLRGINGPGGIGSTTECWTGVTPKGHEPNCTTVTPEPVSMTLLATGLMGMGGAGFVRRRKRKPSDLT
jgi:hypothetical protein